MHGVLRSISPKTKRATAPNSEHVVDFFACVKQNFGGNGANKISSQKINEPRACSLDLKVCNTQ